MKVKKTCKYESEIKYNDHFTFKMVLDNSRVMPPRIDSDECLFISPYGIHSTRMGNGVASFATKDQLVWLITTLSDFLAEIEEEE
jgi:hypothetical protein